MSVHRTVHLEQLHFEPCMYISEVSVQRLSYSYFNGYMYTYTPVNKTILCNSDIQAVGQVVVNCLSFDKKLYKIAMYITCLI